MSGKRTSTAILIGVLCLSALSCARKEQNGSDSICDTCLETSAAASTVRVTGGDIAGYIDSGVYCYKGIPYGTAARFSEATDPAPWDGVRSCRAYGPVSPQGPRAGWYDDEQAFTSAWNDGFQDEDCLRLNVWTTSINDSKKRPVMVWLHGGGFHAGNGQEWPSYDGKALAKGHDVVVVTLNHRLNVLGFLDLSAYGQKYASTGNLGMQDIVKALQWVKNNIATFGGDPSNVTIFGQSGGGGKVSCLMAMPSAKGLFSKAIVESGSITQVMVQKYSRRIGAYTVQELGLGASSLERIKEVPYADLYAAAQKAVEKVRSEAAADGNVSSNLLYMMLFGTEPTVDGSILPFQPGAVQSMELSKDIPTIIGTTYNEFTPTQKDEIFKPLAIEQAKARTEHGCAPVYFYEFDWASPVLDGHVGSSHCLEIPFVFDNVALHNSITGGAPEDIELGHRISSLWTSFARTGVPSAEGMPRWDSFSKEGNTLFLDRESSLSPTI